ncbi:MAG: hypothetical protein IJ191_01840, partial [Treponema sp.]|nr:hypothetical protein [Treponema sp.]
LQKQTRIKSESRCFRTDDAAELIPNGGMYAGNTGQTVPPAPHLPGAPGTRQCAAARNVPVQTDGDADKNDSIGVHQR